ncbi:MAG: cupin domain-containing protein [Nanoarchaeota archaeon]
MKKGNINELNWKDRFTYVKNVPFDEKDLNCKGAKFQLIKFKPNTSVKPHYHKKTYEIFFVLEGEGMMKLNNKDFRCKPGDFFLCQPNDIHEVVNDTLMDFVYLVFKTNEVEGEDIFWL